MGQRRKNIPPIPGFVQKHTEKVSITKIKLHKQTTKKATKINVAKGLILDSKLLIKSF